MKSSAPKKYSYRAHGSCRETLHKQRTNTRPGAPASYDASQYLSVWQIHRTRLYSVPHEASMWQLSIRLKYLHRSLQKRICRHQICCGGLCEESTIPAIAHPISIAVLVGQYRLHRLGHEACMSRIAIRIAAPRCAPGGDSLPKMIRRKESGKGGGDEAGSR